MRLKTSIKATIMPPFGIATITKERAMINNPIVELIKNNNLA